MSISATTPTSAAPSVVNPAPSEDPEVIKLEEPFSEFTYQNDSLECGFYASNNRRATEHVLTAIHDEFVDTWDSQNWDDAILEGECKRLGCVVRTFATLSRSTPAMGPTDALDNDSVHRCRSSASIARLTTGRLWGRYADS